MSGRNVIITGANRGIGLAMVRAFGETGDNIWACARTKTDEFERVLQDVEKENNIWIKPVYFDLLDEQKIRETVKRDIFSEKKDIDILINNAGIAHGGLMTMTPMSKIREVYEVNVFAHIQMMQLIARQMMKQKRGCIINMCSVGGIEHNPGYLAYGSSKAALLWITKSVSKELGQYNIRVNGIAPGLVNTDMGNYKNEDEIEKVMCRMTLKRMGTPEEIAQAAVYLASEDAAYMTGQIMVLDGGRI